MNGSEKFKLTVMERFQAYCNANGIDSTNKIYEILNEWLARQADETEDAILK